jgi:hypothetical protein
MSHRLTLAHRASSQAQQTFGTPQGTLELIRSRPRNPGGYLAHFDVGGHVYSVIHSVAGAAVLGLIVPVLSWLTGLAAVWLLWRPASSAFVKPKTGNAQFGTRVSETHPDS